MVTAYGSEEVLRLSQEAGADAFLMKPVTPSQLLDTLLFTLGRERLLGEELPALTATAPPGSDGLEGARVLLVEDNEINREFAAELLRSAGIEVTEAVDGAAAVARIEEAGFDAVLMDVQMPVLDGYEATRRIRSLESTAAEGPVDRIPIIAMTALAMSQDAERSREAGMDDHVSKPLDPDLLLVTLARWIVRDEDSALPQRSPRTVAAIPTDLLALTTVDAGEGVRRIGGRPDAYRKQLRRFRAHFAHAVSDIEEAVAARDLVTAQERCHVLKGVAGNIGASALHGQLEQIHSDLMTGVIPDDILLDQAQESLAAVLQEIDALPVESPAPAADPAERLGPDDVRDLVGQLTQALQFDLGAAEPLLDRLRRGCAGTALEPEVTDLDALMEVFDVDAALGRLERLDPRAVEVAP
jgi:CheY-like chemotaxis protein